jgi:hypothetical protein
MASKTDTACDESSETDVNKGVELSGETDHGNEVRDVRSGSFSNPRSAGMSLFGIRYKVLFFIHNEKISASGCSARQPRPPAVADVFASVSVALLAILISPAPGSFPTSHDRMLRDSFSLG